MNSALKSATAYLLIALLGIYLMLNSHHSIANCTILSEMLDLLSTFMSRVSIRTLILWAKKYGHNCLADTTYLVIVSLNLGSGIQLQQMHS